MDASRPLLFLVTLVTLAAWAAGASAQQPAENPFESRQYSLDSGLHNNPSDEFVLAFGDVVQAPGASLMRLGFGDTHLGDASYVVLTSLRDGESQHFTARSLPQWSNRSALFNGDALDLELFVAPGEQGIFITIDRVYAYREPGGEQNEFGPAGEPNTTEQKPETNQQ